MFVLEACEFVWMIREIRQVMYQRSLELHHPLAGLASSGQVGMATTLFLANSFVRGHAMGGIEVLSNTRATVRMQVNSYMRGRLKKREKVCAACAVTSESCVSGVTEEREFCWRFKQL